MNPISDKPVSSAEPVSNTALSPEAAQSPPSRTLSPNTMPVPAVPRRAAPPRKRSARSPTPSAQSGEATSQVADNASGGQPGVGASVAHGDAPLEQDNKETYDPSSNKETEPAASALQGDSGVVSLPETKEDIPSPVQRPVTPPPVPVQNDEFAQELRDVPLSESDLSTTESQPVAPDYQLTPHIASRPESDALTQPHEAGIDSRAMPTQLSSREKRDGAVTDTVEDEGNTIAVSGSTTLLPTANTAAEITSPDRKDSNEDEDEVARRQRIAARIAKMGGVNPFGAPHQPPVSSPVASPPAVPAEDQNAPVSPVAGSERQALSLDSVPGSASATAEEPRSSFGPAEPVQEGRVVEGKDKDGK
jgi:myosin tail region-interacting protein MTI1